MKDITYIFGDIEGNQDIYKNTVRCICDNLDNGKFIFLGDIYEHDNTDSIAMIETLTSIFYDQKEIIKNETSADEVKELFENLWKNKGLNCYGDKYLNIWRNFPKQSYDETITMNKETPNDLEYKFLFGNKEVEFVYDLITAKKITRCELKIDKIESRENSNKSSVITKYHAKFLHKSNEKKTNIVDKSVNEDSKPIKLITPNSNGTGYTTISLNVPQLNSQADSQLDSKYNCLDVMKTLKDASEVCMTKDPIKSSKIYVIYEIRTTYHNAHTGEEEDCYRLFTRSQLNIMYNYLMNCYNYYIDNDTLYTHCYFNFDKFTNYKHSLRKIVCGHNKGYGIFGDYKFRGLMIYMVDTTTSNPKQSKTSMNNYIIKHGNNFELTNKFISPGLRGIFTIKEDKYGIKFSNCKVV